MELPLKLPDEHYPVRLRFERPLTDDELQTFCERQEVLHVEREPDGGLSVRPIWGTWAGMVSTDVLVDLGNWAEATDSGFVLPTVGFFLPDGSMRSPKIAFVSKTQWDGLSPELREGFLPICPDFVVEVQSFNYTREELEGRMEMWLAMGAKLGWLIDPERNSIEVFRPGGERESHQGDEPVLGEGPVAGFVLKLDRTWK